MRVLVAMSGGVDSSVAAARLRDAGHDVVGVTMRLWGGPSDTGCCSATEVADARRAAAQLGVDHHVFDFSSEFERHVVDPYVADHAAGRTPNPCVECNRHLKFDVLLRRAEVLGFDAVATGHHARIADVVDEGGRSRRRIGRGADRTKDQSYVLHPIVDADLARVLLPIGDSSKADVRAEAARLGLRTAAKPDSQDVCFITRADGRRAFLEERIDLHPADVVDEAGRSVGRTDAVELVTIGQRKGLGLAGGADRRFVLDVDVAAATVTVGPPEHLRTDDLRVDGVRWAPDVATEHLVGTDVAVQCSAHGSVDAATVSAAGGGTVALRWHEPRRRVAPGQSVVLYDHDGDDATVLAGGLAR
ncbi:tRNA 2-thiouridine(34) synthase MnmA [Dermatobacter hominis]|uniref:tRNA 2-thiouridine(34) synthase MnmA n=1 Tax=Dermatobacter hominis TaxID=2884263 RepID=UPI001D101F64|nr:tRNA 2-thiouridine(34) synthase MnmA [Dermatobacter hominis]UDY37132.1 tRNA 2-thiouridine(34) synthase MnmA [Dermatobacter hominis]